MPVRDDDPGDWFNQMPTVETVIPEPPADTVPHRSLDYLGGREAGFSAGVQAVAASFERELAKAGFSPREAKRICARVRESALRRG